MPPPAGVWLEREWSRWDWAVTAAPAGPLEAGIWHSGDGGPCRPCSGRCAGEGRARLPGELELGRRASRGEDRGRGGQAEVLEDLPDDLAVGDERDELALLTAPGAGEHVDLEDALQELSPGGPGLGMGRPQGVGGEPG